MNQNMPLSMLMESAKMRFVQAFNQVIDETKLPAFLYEAMLLDLLAETRSRKNLELIADINSLSSKEGGGASEEKEKASDN